METQDRGTAVATEAAKEDATQTNGHKIKMPALRERLRDAITQPPFERPFVRDSAEWIKKHETSIAWMAALVLVTAGVFLFKGSAHHAAPANAVVPVNVQTIASQNIRLWSEFSARLQAVDYAEIRPQVGGRITDVRFEDGKQVKKGDVLFVIEPGPFQAALERAQANADFAKTELNRADGLIKAQAIAQRQFDERANASRVADAELERAKIDYAHAYVVAPISGRVGRPEITVGNLVQPANAPLLTSIVSNTGIYADFEMDEQTYLQSIRENASGRDQERAIPVELTVPGDHARTYKGSIYSFDNHIDTVSGTIRARAKFDNKDGVLLPGMFVSIKIGGSHEVPTLLLPERAIGTDQSKKFVYVVDKANKVNYREVTLGKEVGSDRVVLTGLQAGERVIVDGTQHVRPDAVVDAKEVAPAAPAAQAPAPVPEATTASAK